MASQTSQQRASSNPARQPSPPVDSSIIAQATATMTADIIARIHSAFGFEASDGGNQFDQLVQDLKAALGPSSGLDSDDVDVEYLTALMRDYLSSEVDWSRYAFGNASKGYTRNLVDDGNGKSNLLVLVWSPGKGSPIHDHGKAHCLMKILKGDLTEVRYAMPGEDHEGPMEVTYERTHKENEVAYMADELGVHKVWNKGSDFAVSLHLYTPPNVAKGGCNVFNPNTGKRSHVPKCGYDSVHGRRMPSS